MIGVEDAGSSVRKNLGDISATLERCEFVAFVRRRQEKKEVCRKEYGKRADVPS